VAFFSTGDELVSIGSQPAAGQIFDSNRYTLYGMLQRLNCEVLDMGVVRDDPALLERAFSDAAAAADVVITSGGVSVGEADFVKDLLERLGEVVFWKIAMKPGRPLAYGKIGGAHFFGLPGNPVSVMVTFYQFVRDALLKLSGRDPIPSIPTFKVPCVSSLKKAPGRTEFQRGILESDGRGAWSVRVTGEQGSGILRSMSEANCFIILPTDQGNVTPGTLVDVQVPRRHHLDGCGSNYPASRHRAGMHAGRTASVFESLFRSRRRGAAPGAGRQRQREDEPCCASSAACSRRTRARCPGTAAAHASWAMNTGRSLPTSAI
jgi:molybdopterin molybdotransferase